MNGWKQSLIVAAVFVAGAGFTPPPAFAPWAINCNRRIRRPAAAHLRAACTPPPAR